MTQIFRNSTRLAVMTLAVASLGACSQLGHSSSARYESSPHAAGYAAAHHSAGWDVQHGAIDQSAWQVADGYGGLAPAGAGFGPVEFGQTGAFDTQAGFAVPAPGAFGQGAFATPGVAAPFGNYAVPGPVGVTQTGRYGTVAAPAPQFDAFGNPVMGPGSAPTLRRSRYGTGTGGAGDVCCIIPQIVYVDRVQRVEVPVEVERVVEVEKIVEVPVEVERIVEVDRPVYIEVPAPPTTYPTPPTPIPPTTVGRK